jgi:hypothetical protein
VNTVWVVMGLSAAGALVAAFASWRRSAADVDLGAVSHQWISEHRLGRQGEDARH